MRAILVIFSYAPFILDLSSVTRGSAIILLPFPSLLHHVAVNRLSPLLLRLSPLQHRAIFMQQRRKMKVTKSIDCLLCSIERSLVTFIYFPFMKDLD